MPVPTTWMPGAHARARVPAGEAMHPRRAALLLVFVVAIAYSSSIGVPFQFDDGVVITGEPAITGFHVDPASHRFLGDLSFAVSYRLFGERPLGYHVVNIAIHAANALLVLRLGRLLFRTQALRSARAAGERVALLGALVFAAHPLNTQAVTYIVQRYASLAAGFFLLATCSYLAFRLASSARAAAGFYALFLASAAAALWTKENAFVLPLAVLLVELSFFSAPARKRLLFLSPFLIGAAAAVAVALASGLSLEGLDRATRVGTDMPRSDYALTQLRVVASYLRLLVLPVGQNIDHDVPLSRSILDPRVLLAASVHASLLAGAALAIARGSRGNALWRLVGFGISWFYVALLVESSFVPIVDVMFEHRAYLPSVGFFLAAAGALAALPTLSPARRWGVLTVALVVALTALTLARNRVWQSDATLWADAASKSPNKPRPLNNVGVALLTRGDPAEAIVWFRRAIRADPAYTKAHFNLGEALQKVGACEEAIAAYETFLGQVPEYPDTYRNLADCYRETGRPEIAAWFGEAYTRIMRERAGRPLPVSLR